jgi:monofunctional biosynthetic peptidoglycan transglycosylase
MLKYLKKIIYFILIFYLLAVVWGRFFNPIITWTQLGGLFQYQKLDREYVSYDEMGDYVKIAVIASEDQNYYKHDGFDFKAIERAMENNEKGKRIQGGSTISQQTAKNIFLWNNRSWLRKGLEVVFTFVIEKVWNKKIIMERYLNSIEMGQGVFGVEAASRYYFKKSAKNLTKSEAAWIAAVLPNPKKYDPKNPTPALKRKHSWIMKQMNHIRLQD